MPENVAALVENPALSHEQASTLLDRHWGVAGTLRDVGSTQDQNLRVDAADAKTYVLKVTDVRTGRESLELQNAALVAVRGIDADVPALVPTVSGQPIVAFQGYLIRLLTWVDGVPLSDRRRLTRSDVHAMGALAGELAGALRDFDHPGLAAPSHWNAVRTGDVLSHLIGELQQQSTRGLVRRTLDAYRQAPGLDRLSRYAVHGDVSDLNTVCRPGAGTGSRPVGVLDFGDVMSTWRPADAAAVAVAVAGRADTSDVLDAAVAVLEGYQSRCVMTRDEVSAYWPLVLARAGLCLATSTRLAELNPDSAFIQQATELDMRAVRTLLAVPQSLAAAATRMLRRASVSSGFANPGEVSEHNPQSAEPLLIGKHPIVTDTELRILDQSVESEDFAFGEWDDPAALATRLTAGTVGRWGELRLTGAGRPSPDPRSNLSLGSERFCVAGTPVHAPVNSTVAQVGPDSVTLRVACDSPPPGVEDDLRLRLSGIDPSVPPGSKLQAGQVVGHVAAIGAEPLSSHVHVQLMRAPDLPRSGTAAHRAAWLQICPDPSGLIGVDVAAIAPTPAPTLRAAHDVSVAAPQHLYFRVPPEIVRGWRHYLYDSVGRPYLDMVNNVATVGHSHPRVAAAATRQFGRLNTNSRFLYGSMARYAERIRALLPPELSAVFFVNSGSEAADLALQLAQVYTGRQDLIALVGAYHGWTGSVLQVCSNEPDRPNWRTDLAPHVHPVEAPDPYRGRFGADGPRYADDVTRACRDAAARGPGVAALISEALLGNAGGIAAAPGYLAAAYAHVRAAGGLCIADEVQVGFGRTGASWWAFEQEGVEPDIVLSAKSVGNGHPVGFVACRAQVAAAFDAHTSFFSSTAGSPVSCEIGLAVLDVIVEEGLQQNALVVGRRLQEGLTELAGRHEAIGAIHGRGLFLGVELVCDRISKAPAITLAMDVCERMLSLGVIVQPTGAGGNILKIKPPLCLDADAADYFVQMLDRALLDVG